MNDGFSLGIAIGANKPSPLAAQALPHAPAGVLARGACAEALPVSVMRVSIRRPVASGACDDLHL